MVEGYLGRFGGRLSDASKLDAARGYPDSAAHRRLLLRSGLRAPPVDLCAPPQPRRDLRRPVQSDKLG